MNIGRAKIIVDRWRNYVGSLQFVLIVLMYISQRSLSPWWIVAGFIGSIAWMWVDMRYVVTAEYEAQMHKNQDMTEKLKKIDHIEKMLEKLTEGK